jgi:hypothetical protein
MYPGRHTKQIKKLEERLISVAVSMAKLTLNKDLPLANDKQLTLAIKYEQLHNRWLAAYEKSMIGRMKTIECKYKRKPAMAYVWHEDFVDEDTGEVVSIERTEIYKIDGVLVNTHYQPILFSRW